jgi:hypothetical protein
MANDKNITIYWKDGTANVVPEFDLSYWLNQGWSTTKPAPVPLQTSAPVPPQTTQPVSSLPPQPAAPTPGNFQTTSQKNESGEIINPTQQDVSNFNKQFTTEIVDPNAITVPIINNGNLPIFVQFNGDPNGPAEGDQSTIWLYFPDKKRYIPFTSMEAFTKFTNGVTPEQLKATGQLWTLNPLVLASPQWGGGVPMNQLFGSPQQGYQSNGLLPDGTNGLEETKTNYGRSSDPQKYKNSAYLVDGLITLLKKSGTGSVSSATIDKILMDTDTLKKYATAIAYGGYASSDILKDIKRIDLVSQGNTVLQNAVIIHPSLSKEEYQVTPQYTSAVNNPLVTLPTISGLDMSALDLPINKMPDQIYNTIVPILPDPTSQEFRDMMSEIEAAYYDVVDMQINAQTEVQKNLAAGEWEKFKEDVATKYGLQLSNNAQQAWTEIQSLKDTYNQRNLGESGLFNESLDNYLRNVRKQDEVTRFNKTNETDSTTREYYQKYATVDEVKALVQKDPTKAQSWGLLPSPNVKQQFSLENLKKLYPDTPDYLLERYASSIIDEYGNYRSQLYQNAYSNKIKNLESKESYQSNKIISDYKAKEEKAYKPYEISAGEDVLSSSYKTPTSVTTPQTSVPTQPPTYYSQTSSTTTPTPGAVSTPTQPPQTQSNPTVVPPLSTRPAYGK